MMAGDTTIVLASPAAPARLFLLFHGVGGRPGDLEPLGGSLARACPDAAVMSVQAPAHADFGSGYQWFPVSGITEESRPGRVAQAMPRFVETVRLWQQRTGVAVANTVLVGFSQGAIMSLESTQLQGAGPLAGRVVSMSGRFAVDPARVPAATRLHFIHGMRDPVIPHSWAQRAAESLQQRGADVTTDWLPGLAHGIDAHVLERLLLRLAGGTADEGAH